MRKSQKKKRYIYKSWHINNNNFNYARRKNQKVKHNKQTQDSKTPINIYKIKLCVTKSYTNLNKECKKNKNGEYKWLIYSLVLI